MVEDNAYCLVGIFGIQLAPMYGEGQNAFVRLQEEILKHIPDQTIFAWGDAIELRDLRDALGRLRVADGPQPPPTESDARLSSDSYLFASSPKKFFDASNSLTLRPISANLGAGNAESTITPYGIRATFPVLPVDPNSRNAPDTQEYFLALLGCWDSLKCRTVALLLRKSNNDFAPESSASVGAKVLSGNTTKRAAFVRLVLLDDIEVDVRQGAALKAIYIPYRATHTTAQIADDAHFLTALHSSHTPINVTIPSWCQNLLDQQGYTVSQCSQYSSDSPPTGHLLITLKSRSQQSENVDIELGHCERCDGNWLRATVSSDSLGTSHARNSPSSADPRRCTRDHLTSWRAYNRTISEVFNVPTPLLPDRCIQLTFRLQNRTGNVLGDYALEIEILDLDHLGKGRDTKARRNQTFVGAPLGMDRVGGRSRSADGTERRPAMDLSNVNAASYTTDNVPAVPHVLAWQ